jgi:predicted PurR-regulated permease PerM
MADDITGWSRPSLLTLTIGVATALSLAASLALLVPFLPAVTWSLTLAVVIQPVYRRLASPRYPRVSAVAGVLAVTILIVGPALVLGIQIASEARNALHELRGEEVVAQWKNILGQHPALSKWVAWLQDQFDVKSQLQGAAESLGNMLPAFVGGSLWIVVQLLITLFILFYLLRDWLLVLEWLHDHSPFTERETTVIFQRIRDCLQATVLGNIFTALVQGILGGLMMGMLGLPFPILWGAVMAMCSLIPTLGAPVVWVPAVLMLLVQGSLGKGMILAVWGIFVIGTIDNILYPILVGKKVTLHTVPIFLSYLGGVVLFGFSGLVLGPLIVALTWAFLEIWRQRTAGGRDATEPQTSARGRGKEKNKGTG